MWGAGIYSHRPRTAMAVGTWGMVRPYPVLRDAPLDHFLVVGSYLRAQLRHHDHVGGWCPAWYGPPQVTCPTVGTWAPTTWAYPSLNGPAVQPATVMPNGGKYHPSANWLCTTCGLRSNALGCRWQCCTTTSTLETHGWRLLCTRRPRCINEPLAPSSVLSSMPLIVASSQLVASSCMSIG